MFDMRKGSPVYLPDAQRCMPLGTKLIPGFFRVGGLNDAEVIAEVHVDTLDYEPQIQMRIRELVTKLWRLEMSLARTASRPCLNLWTIYGLRHAPLLDGSRFDISGLGREAGLVEASLVIISA